jgi:DNA-binding FadR family transcriptional regulator
MDPLANGSRLVRVPKAAEIVADRIRRQIVSGRLGDGDALPSERELIAEHGVSRPTIREAIRLLEADGLVFIQRGPGGGARACAPTRRAAALQMGILLEYLHVPLSDLLDAMDRIQLGAAATLARDHTPADIAALRVSLERGTSHIDNPDALVRDLSDFHVELVRRTGNEALVLIHSILAYIMQETVRRRSDPDPGKWGQLVPTEGLRRHRELVEQIEAGNIDEADIIWRGHLNECHAFTLATTSSATAVDILGGETIRSFV